MRRDGRVRHGEDWNTEQVEDGTGGSARGLSGWGGVGGDSAAAALCAGEVEGGYADHGAYWCFRG